MSQRAEPHNLQEVLERLGEAAHERERVSLGRMLDLIGRRSFGPLVLVAGLIMSAPIIGDIPGVPTLLGGVVSLIALQILFQRECIWLPQWMLRRSAAQDKVDKSIEKMKRPARFIDRMLKPRLRGLTTGRLARVILAVSLLISAATPLMEFVPFSANIAGAALVGFGLSLIAHDGLLALFAYAFTAATVGVVAAQFI